MGLQYTECFMVEHYSGTVVKYLVHIITLAMNALVVNRMLFIPGTRNSSLCMI